MSATSSPLAVPPFGRGDHLAVLVLTAVVLSCGLYANLGSAVRDPAAQRFFPPFRPNVNANLNNRLVSHTEYGHIARALRADEGYANPFGGTSGPTAWMAPVLPTFLAGLFWMCDGDREIATAVIVLLQMYVLIV